MRNDMYAYVFINAIGEFDIYQSPFIGERITMTARDIGLSVIYVAM